MTWRVEIHIIDVGQGESSLIIASDAITGQSRTMLIDAGLPIYGRTVHDYVARALVGKALDYVLVSHYDADHSGGIKSLLIADNLYCLSEIIAQAAGRAAFDAARNAPVRTQSFQVAAAAAAAAAAASGGYSDGGADYSDVAVRAGQDQWYAVILPGTPHADTARHASIDGEAIASREPNLNGLLLPSTRTRRSAAQQAGIVAGTAGGTAAARSAAALPVVALALRAHVPQGSGFLTNALYRDVEVIDIGDTPHMDSDYAMVINGAITFKSGHRVLVPGTNRTRTSALDLGLGTEILWRSGAPISPNWPALFIVACRKSMWKAPGPKIPIASGQPDNDDSIGLVLRFNNFFYYTGGDLPSQGEDLVATAIRKNGLPNPLNPGNPFAAAPNLACFKCGHHGSEHSTSAAFLAATRPSAAFISAGYKPFGAPGIVHPAQEVVDRLHNAGSVRRFFLTNCREKRNHVPASQEPPEKQVIAANKSRLAGDNRADNLQLGRYRGNFQILVSEYLTLAVPRQCWVRYYEADLPHPSLRSERINF